MTVPRKITTQHTGSKLRVYKEGTEAGTELLVGTVHKPRQGGIKFIPL